MQSAGLALLMDGIISSGLLLKIRVPVRLSAIGVAKYVSCHWLNALSGFWWAQCAFVGPV